MERCHPFIDWYETFLCTWLAGMCYIFPPEHWSLTAVVWLAHKQALSPLRCISYIQLSPIVFGATHANGLINLWYSLGQSESLAKYLISVVISNQTCSMSGKNMEGNKEKEKLVSGLPFARRLVIYGFSSKRRLTIFCQGLGPFFWGWQELNLQALWGWSHEKFVLWSVYPEW